MDDSTRRVLTAELGPSLPSSLERLDDREVAALAATLAEARARQERAVEDAIDKAMRFIPWGLRGTVKRVLLG